MRTPNTACIICNKPLYRRPYELAKVRYVVCMEHRVQAQNSFGVTDAQRIGLKLETQKGTNHRKGYKHKPESKLKISASNRKYWAEHPDRAIARGEKTRGEFSCHWKGGRSRLNISIRQMCENRKWMNAIKLRDGKCVRCGSIVDLEAHHYPKSFSELISELSIKSRDDARANSAVLWAIEGGITLCQPCHYAVHGRKGQPGWVAISTATVSCKSRNKFLFQIVC